MASFALHSAGTFTFEVGTDTLTLTEDLSVASTGGKVWETALILAKYFERDHAKLKRVRSSPSFVIEVGCGCGLLGMAVAVLSSAHVVLTDVPIMLQHTQRVLDCNAGVAAVRARVTTHELDWESSTDSTEQLLAHARSGAEAKDDVHPALIVGSDVIFAESLVNPLLSTLDRLSGPLTDIYLCVEPRNEQSHQMFLERAAELFRVKRIPHSRLHKDFRSTECVVLHLRKILANPS